MSAHRQALPRLLREAIADRLHVIELDDARTLRKQRAGIQALIEAAALAAADESTGMDHQSRLRDALASLAGAAP